MMPIAFTKMHGLGNEYLHVDCFDQQVEDPAALARAIADRNLGVGGDELILMSPPEVGVDAHIRMRIFNADGSEAEMCGNGIRCVCKYAFDHGTTFANPMRIQTGAGVMSLEHEQGDDGLVEMVTVDMGSPLWEADEAGVIVEELGGLMVLLAEEVAGESYRWLSMGNPHIVFFCRDVKRIPLAKWGPMIEMHKAFPNRVNAHFAKVHSAGEVTMRTWERGSGATLACGTGAAAVCVAGVANELTDRKLLVHLPGGSLRLNWDEGSGHVFMTGPAVEVFSGVWPG